MNYDTLLCLLTKKISKTHIGIRVVKASAFLFIQLLVSNSCIAQNYSQLSISDTITFYSKVFDTERQVIITKSSKIKNDEKQNNCILYMDADDQNINGIFLQSANNLMANKEIPESYLIGIIHKNRNTEFLEKDKLLNFLREELIPLLKDKFNIAYQLTIVGHSFGGYFATYAFLKDNNIYNSCVAISPAYWPNNSEIINLLLEKENFSRGNLYLSIGDKRWDEISLRKEVLRVQNILKNQKNIVFSFNELKGFSHNATPTVGFGLGLGFIYDKWEWTNILEEQENNLKLFPSFWGHIEIKADALFHLDRVSEAKLLYQEALRSTSIDEKLSNSEMSEVVKRLHKKIKKCR